MRAAYNFRIPKSALTLHTAWQDLTQYRWGSRTGCDYFCSNCGIMVFRQPSALTAAELAQGTPEFDGWAVNLKCVDDLDSDSLSRVEIDGKSLAL